jgi:transcriptional regulator of arginine metabolism
VEVAQATLSRDLKSLGVGKRPGPDGRAMYVLPQPAAEVLDRSRLHLDLKAFINSIDSAQNLVVVRTPPGHAHAVGRAIDLLEDPDVVGSVAGDDTVLVVLSDSPCARRFRRQLLSLSGLAGARRQ